jgi:hypothetical protein
LVSAATSPASAAQLALPEAAELEDLEDVSDVDARQQGEHPEAEHHERPLQVDVAVSSEYGTNRSARASAANATVQPYG